MALAGEYGALVPPIGSPAKSHAGSTAIAKLPSGYLKTLPTARRCTNAEAPVSATVVCV